MFKSSLSRPFTIAVSALLLPLSITLAHTEPKAIKEYKFDLNGISDIAIHGGVGSINVIHTDAKQASVVLEITQKNHHWWKSDIDLDSVELHDRRSSGRLTLRQTDEDINIEWTVELPSIAQTSIELGVGSIDAEIADSDVHVNLGVGEVKLRMPEQSAGDIRLNTGVGDAKLLGGEITRHKREMISQKISGHGKGSKDIDVTVGVGDIRVTLEPLRH
ncbi:MAG TPA: hypothetical protein VMH83_10390 [Candidatus Acidoferrum sp.]|nr:hypothetical protein [Candidatus Acidoferrum sp.]